MAERSKSGAGKEDIEAQIKTIRDDVGELMNLMRALGTEKLDDVSKTASEKADEWVQRSRKSIDEANKSVKAKAANVEDFIVEKPLQSAFIALLLGLFIGSMSRR